MTDTLTEATTRAITTPVDPDLFAFAVDLFNRAAAGQVAGAHLPRPDPAEGGGLTLTNHPVNRGMMAVYRETRHLDDAARMALGMRLMEFGRAIELAAEDPRLAMYVRPFEGGSEIDPRLVRAIAQCRYVVDGEDALPDLDHLVQLLDENPAA